jgi:hypothetical protein
VEAPDLPPLTFLPSVSVMDATTKAAAAIHKVLAGHGHGPRPWAPGQVVNLMPWEDLPERWREEYREAAAAALAAAAAGERA